MTLDGNKEEDINTAALMLKQGKYFWLRLRLLWVFNTGLTAGSCLKMILWK